MTAAPSAFRMPAKGGTFREQTASVRPKPAEVAELRPDHFADTWPEKPVAAVSVGLRLVSEADLQAARAQAAQRARQLFPDPEIDDEERVDCFNDSLAAWVVARGTTQPTDATQPWMDLAHDNVQLALTSPGLHYLFDRLMMLAAERSPLSPEASDEEVARLCEALHDGAAWASADAPQARRARRLLRRAMDLLAL